MISTAPAVKPRVRIEAIDIIRGVVMVLMAIDHVRVYSGQPAGGPTAGIFFTRWVTHFCAPAFVFFAGTGAFLHGRQLGDGPAAVRSLARYLITRGLLLIALELTVIRLSWTFNGDYSQFVLAGVIWMLGWCMVLLAGLVSLPTRVVGAIGVFIIFFQQIFAILPRAFPESVQANAGWVWEFIYPAGLHRLPGITILYVLVPWIGVMAAGYAFGAIVIRAPAERRRLCLRIGLTATALFVVLSGLIVSLQSGDGRDRPAFFDFLDPPKYPASQAFLLMTLGPTIALLPYVERARGGLANVLITFGRVPLFYYLLHIPVIHATALIVWFLRDGTVHADWFRSAPFVSVPPEGRWGLPLLYLVWLVVIAILYGPCRWFADVKARRKDGWLRYL